MRTAFFSFLALSFACIVTLPAWGQEKQTEKPKERDVFNYAAQEREPKEVRKIVFIADTRPHGAKGNHEFCAGAVYIAKTINGLYPNAYAVVHPHTRLPKDLSHADSVIVLMNEASPVATNPAVKAAMERGAGFMAIHYGVEVKKGEAGDNFKKWMGGYFETFWSVNPVWTADFKEIPEHETTRGVKPFKISDEWYYHMRFVDDMKGVTPVLSALPTLATLKNTPKATERGSNPDVFKEVSEGKLQHMAWAYVRPDKGRGFGFSGYHNYSNLKNDSFRTLLLNGAAWVSNLDIPAAGIPSEPMTDEALEKYYQESLRLKN